MSHHKSKLKQVISNGVTGMVFLRPVVQHLHQMLLYFHHSYSSSLSLATFSEFHSSSFLQPSSSHLLLFFFFFLLGLVLIWTKYASFLSKSGAYQYSSGLGWLVGGGVVGFLACYQGSWLLC